MKRRASPRALALNEAPTHLHWLIAWRHLRAGARPPVWVWPALGLALYLLAVGTGFSLYALHGLAPEAMPEFELIEPLVQLATPKQSYYGALGVATIFVGGTLLLAALLSLVFTLLATVITVSVMLGCMALVVVLSLMTGLELELRDKILGQRAHIRVSASDGRPFADYLDLATKINEIPGIIGASPYLQGELMVRSGFQRQGGILLGIDSELHARVSNLPEILREGDYSFLAEPEKIPDSAFGLEILPIEPPSEPPMPARAAPDEDVGAAGTGATALPKRPDAKASKSFPRAPALSPRAPAPNDASDKVGDDDSDAGWEDPELEIAALQGRGALPFGLPPAPHPLIPRPRGQLQGLFAGDEEGWEDPELEIERLRAEGKLPPATKTTEPEPEPEPEAEPESEVNDKPILEGIFIGSEKAKELAARTGDQVQLITPIGRLTPAGRIPGVMAVKVAGVFDADHYEYDRWLVYSTLPVAQAFLRAGDRVTGLEIKVDDIDLVPERRRRVEQVVAAMGRTDLIVQDWQELNRSLFSAMALEKIAVFVALLCVILVASFGILGSNLMSVIEKSKEIAILKTIGCTSTLIQRIFIAEGLFLGILGGILGISTGIGLCAWLDRYGLPLSGSLQSLEHLPVAVDAFEVALVGVSSLGIVWLSSQYPAWIASRMRPVDALRQAER